VTTIALVAVNMFVAFAVVFQRWGYYPVLLTYWCEAMIIGVFGLARMCVACWFGNPFGRSIAMKDTLTRLVMSAILAGFFIAKFGGFALAMGFWVVATPGILADADDGRGLRMVAEALRGVGGAVGIAVVLLFVSHGFSFVANFVGQGEYRDRNAIALLFAPYLRMALMLVVLAAAFVVAMAVPEIHRETAFAVVVVVAKLLVDAASHRFEHRTSG
jgi:hypothetical protein